MLKSKNLTAQEINWLLNLTRKDITQSFMIDNFAVVGNNEAPKFNTYDKFTLQKGKFYNSETIETTIGRYIFNIFVLPESYLKLYGYFNKTLTKGELGSLEGIMSTLILNDKLSVKDYAEYLDNGEWIGMGNAYFLSPTMNYEINVPFKEVIQKRDELFDKYSEEIEAGDPNAAEKIEKETLQTARAKLETSGNDAYDFFKSGEFSFENNYKKASVMAGAVENPFTKKIDILKSNYINGVSKEEYPKLSNLSIVGGYSRGVETESGGYESKKINNALQTIVLDEKDSDCGTTFYQEIMITEKMASSFLYRYIIENGKLVLLDEDNIKNYIGKTVKMRSPLYCKSPKICNKCAGELFYKLNIKNAGILTSTFSGSVMNLSMKKMHDTTVRFKKIKIEDFIKEK